MPDPEKLKEYIQSVAEMLDKKNGKGLSSAERRLGTKLGEIRTEIEGLNNDMGRMQETMQQSQQRLDNMTRHHLELVSKASGFIESLITLKFGDEIEKEEAGKRTKEAVEKKAKGNGTKDPSPLQKRKKRVKKSKRSQPTAS